MSIKFTPTAANEIKKILENQDMDNPKLRVGVKGGGCSGFSYILDITKEHREQDEVFESEGLQIICDPKSLLYLDGTVIDFKDELVARGFVFNNPNATSPCGCNQSFAV